MKALAIHAWARVFETSLFKDASAMLSLPMKRGTGYARLAKLPNGAAAYGVWISLLTIALGCVPRGTLVFTDKAGTHAHDAESLALVTGFCVSDLEVALKTLAEIGWLEEVEFEIPEVKVKPPNLEEFLAEMKAKSVYNGQSLTDEWTKALKGMKPSDARRVFKQAVPGISYPREFIKARKDMGL